MMDAPVERQQEPEPMLGFTTFHIISSYHKYPTEPPLERPCSDRCEAGSRLQAAS